MTQDAPQDKPSPSRPSFGRDLTTGSIPRHLIVFCVPMLVGSALQSAYVLVNRIWVGRFLGETELAAVAISFPIFFILTALSGGLTLATNILISQHYGAGDMASVRRVVRSSTLLVGGLSLGLLALGEQCLPLILRLMNTPPEVFPTALSYMRVLLLSMPLMFGLFLSRNMLQAVGDSLTPVYFLGGSLVLNAALDPVLMLGLLGVPRLGLNGTAWATLVSQALALGALAAWLKKRGSPVALSIGRESLEGATAWTTIRIGLPSAVQQSLISLGMMFVAGFVNGFGKRAAAAWGIAMGIDQWAFLPAMTFSMAVATLAGQNIGAGRHDRVRQVFLWGCLLSGGATLAISATVVSLPRPLLHIFTDEPALLDLGRRYLWIVGPCYVFFAIMFVSNGIINGSGHTLVITAISLVSQWGVRVPLAWWLSRRLGSVEGVWYAIAASFAVSMLVSLAYYSTGRWRQAVVHRRPAGIPQRDASRLEAPPPPPAPRT